MRGKFSDVPRKLHLMISAIVLGATGVACAGILLSGTTPRATRKAAGPEPMKSARASSPDGLHVAYGVSAPADEGTGRAEFIVVDSAGKEVLHSAQLINSKFGDNCTPGDIQWLDNRRAGLVCAYDPFVKTYFVFDIQTGSRQEYNNGYWFKWSPDAKSLAHLTASIRFGTPEGQNTCLFLDERAIYPPGCDRARSSYSHIHSFVLPPVWSPDSSRVALIEKIFDWEYSDPFGRYFDGAVSNVRYYLAIASKDRPASGYVLTTAPERPQLEWQSDSKLALDGRTYDLQANPAVPIP
jgi:hypothetical protein